jgi:hypothetical protein
MMTSANLCYSWLPFLTYRASTSIFTRIPIKGRMQMTNETFGQIGILCQVSRTDQAGGDLIWTWRREPWHCNHLVRSL